MNLIDVVNEIHANPKVKDIPDFRTGDTISVHARITEGSKSRIQIFQGVCIAIKRKGSVNGHFRVRKVSNGVGVERVFPYHSHNIDKVEVLWFTVVLPSFTDFFVSFNMYKGRRIFILFSHSNEICDKLL